LLWLFWRQSLELYAWAGLEPWSPRQPPK
jgi:hypothetical protein